MLLLILKKFYNFLPYIYLEIKLFFDCYFIIYKIAYRFFLKYNEYFVLNK